MIFFFHTDKLPFMSSDMANQPDFVGSHHDFFHFQRNRAMTQYNNCVRTLFMPIHRYEKENTPENFNAVLEAASTLGLCYTSEYDIQDITTNYDMILGGYHLDIYDLSFQIGLKCLVCERSDCFAASRRDILKQYWGQSIPNWSFKSKTSFKRDLDDYVDDVRTYCSEQKKQNVEAWYAYIISHLTSLHP